WRLRLHALRLTPPSDSHAPPPGNAIPFTRAGTITGGVTNAATASGAFNDPASTSASASKSATVTGHVCTISLTKTPSQTSVCNGASVTYTYIVSNNSDAFTWTGTLSDAKLWTTIGTITRVPGLSQPLTAPATTTGSVTSLPDALPIFNDPASTSASASKSATVTGHVCTISLTKTPSQTSVCNGASVTYTYIVSNNSDAFTWTG